MGPVGRDTGDLRRGTRMGKHGNIHRHRRNSVAVDRPGRARLADPRNHDELLAGPCAMALQMPEHASSRAALLAWVSTEGQADDARHSLPAQLWAMRVRCTREGWDVVRDSWPLVSRLRQTTWPAGRYCATWWSLLHGMSSTCCCSTSRAGWPGTRNWRTG